MDVTATKATTARNNLRIILSLMARPKNGTPPGLKPATRADISYGILHYPFSSSGRKAKPRWFPAGDSCQVVRPSLEVALSAEQHVDGVLVLELIQSCRLGNRSVPGLAIVPEDFWSKRVQLTSAVKARLTGVQTMSRQTFLEMCCTNNTQP